MQTLSLFWGQIVVITRTGITDHKLGMLTSLLGTPYAHNSNRK